MKRTSNHLRTATDKVYQMKTFHKYPLENVSVRGCEINRAEYNSVTNPRNGLE